MSRRSKGGPRKKPLAGRLWAKVDRSGDCWVWTGSRTGGRLAYGHILTYDVNGKRAMRGVHRVSYELTVGRIPKKMDVCHKCDNGLCVRPSHLFVGTRRANMQDAVRKGRQRTVPLKGTANGMAVLTEQDVRQIRRTYRPGYGTRAKFAKRYRVSTQTIWHIVTGRTWKHIPLTVLSKPKFGGWERREIKP